VVEVHYFTYLWKGR